MINFNSLNKIFMPVTIIPYESKYANDFKNLNIAWLKNTFMLKKRTLNY